MKPNHLILPAGAERWRGSVFAMPEVPGDPMAALEAYHREVQAITQDHGASLDRLAIAVAALQVGGAGAPDERRDADMRAAVTAFVRSGNPQAMGEFVSAQVRAVFAMTADSSPDGGYLVPDQMASSIFELQRDASPMRRLASVITTAGGDYSQPVNKSGTGAAWVGEREIRPETAAPALALITWPTHEIYANPAVTQKLLDDSSVDVARFLENELAKTFAEAEGSAFISGDGINKPRGILGYDVVSAADTNRDFGKFQYKPSGVAAALTDGTHNGIDALTDVVYSLKAGYRQNANWLMNSATAAVISKIKSANEELYLWQPAVSKGQPPLLLGYPVEFDESMPDIAANALPIAFGDFKRGYLINDRLGVRILRDPYSNKPYVHFYTTKRVGGGALDTNAIKFLKIATT